jgi:Response regulators consisting of a CheY-like receiver domain and a winged-helix DNA-binding domain
MNKTIYVLEDDLDIGELVSFLLNEQGYGTTVFGSIASFQQVATQPPALLIIDIMLPDGNGLDVCAAWKSDPATQAVPILLMSAYEDYRRDERALKADDFISKPFDIKDFLARVRMHLGE